MTNTENPYSRKYEFPSDRGVYNKVVGHPDFKKICGEVGDSLLVRGSSENLFLIERKDNKEILKIHSNKPEAMQSQLENITGVVLSQYRKY